jgi:mxaL protein
LGVLDGIDGRMRWGNASQVSKGLFWALRAAKDIDPKPALLFPSDGHEAPPVGDEQISLFEPCRHG